MTPLHLAAVSNSVEIVELLLATKKVDIKLTSNNGMTAIECTKNQDIIKLINQYSNSSWCIIA